MERINNVDKTVIEIDLERKKDGIYQKCEVWHHYKLYSYLKDKNVMF